MQDILPAQQKLWQFALNSFVQLCEQAGLQRIDTPVLESTELFARAVGESTEIVNKEMYTFTDKADNSLTLKPEGTAGVVRAYIENGMSSLPKPVSLYYVGQHFRYERPQAGRFRQHHQVGIEIFGDSSNFVDVHAIALGYRWYQSLGLKVTVSINSIGNASDRARYIEALRTHLEKYQADLPEINKRQLETNPLRILDSKDPDVIKTLDGSPDLLDYLSKESQKRLTEILELLEKIDIPYELNNRLVRGLDYYNDTVFEYLATEGGVRDSLGGGGRYDGLVEQMGGQQTPAVGFGLGLERTYDYMVQSGVDIPAEPLDVFVAVIGQHAAPMATEALETLLNNGLSARSGFQNKSISIQLSAASKLKARYAVIVGEKEAKSGSVIVKDLEAMSQQTVPLLKLVGFLKTDTRLEKD
jgi:histidyl-tRNA synthetase